MKLPPMSKEENEGALSKREIRYREAIKSGVHKCGDCISSVVFKEQVEEIVHEMKVLRRRLGISSEGDEWLKRIIYP